MKTRITRIDEMTIEDFAEQHHLVMEINERRVSVGDPRRYYASFNGAELKGDGVLIGSYGNGATESEAIANYAAEISLGRLVVDAFKPSRREIAVPRLAGRKDAD